MQIAMLHYASPPVVGGVETTLSHHARVLVASGYRVRLISGAGSADNPDVETVVDPDFGSSDADILALKVELDAGTVSSVFIAQRDAIAARLRDALRDCDVCIAHNVPTMNKNLALTAALHQICAETGLRLFAWCHDVAWTNPQYQPELHDGYPWELLRRAWPNTHYVTVSEPRRTELAALIGVPEQMIRVIVPGVDPVQFFQWTPTMRHLESRLGLLDADTLLLLPARLTRRKNVEFALHVLAAIRRQSGADVRLVVTGPPGPHNPGNMGYYGELLALRGRLQLERAAHFVYEPGESGLPLIPDDTTLANLYQLADGLFFPSAQEGFGIPLLEAGLAGIPVFCADIPPLRATGLHDVMYFDPASDQPAMVASIVMNGLRDSPAARLKARVRRSYRWDVIVRNQLIPLLHE